jgi:ATP-dependent helicase YprA (DUF1998 family)
MPLGRSIGLGDAYYRQTPEQCLNAYLKVVEDLIINKENRSAKHVHELKTKKEDSEYIIKGNLREMMEKSQEKDEQIKVLKTQIEKLNNETKSNIEEFINIAKQIQEITSRTKIDPNTRKKMKTRESGRDGIFELYIQDREQKRKRKQEPEQHLQKYTIQEQQQQERC